MFDKTSEGESARQSLYAMFQNCHPYVHSYPPELTREVDDAKEQKPSYIQLQAMLLRHFDEYITNENDKVFLNNILNSDKISD